jgi:hypothetical protein
MREQVWDLGLTDPSETFEHKIPYERYGTAFGENHISIENSTYGILIPTWEDFPYGDTKVGLYTETGTEY